MSYCVPSSPVESHLAIQRRVKCAACLVCDLPWISSLLPNSFILTASTPISTALQEIPLRHCSPLSGNWHFKEVRDGVSSVPMSLIFPPQGNISVPDLLSVSCCSDAKWRW